MQEMLLKNQLVGKVRPSKPTLHREWNQYLYLLGYLGHLTS